MEIDMTISSEAVELRRRDVCAYCGALPCDQVNDPRTPDPRLERLIRAGWAMRESGWLGKEHVELEAALDAYNGGEA
jgi:hypothetical protein